MNAHGHPAQGRDGPAQVPQKQEEDGAGQADEQQRAEVDGQPGARLLTEAPEDVVLVGGWMESAQLPVRGSGWNQH